MSVRSGVQVGERYRLAPLTHHHPAIHEVQMRLAGGAWRSSRARGAGERTRTRTAGSSWAREEEKTRSVVAGGKECWVLCDTWLGVCHCGAWPRGCEVTPTCGPSDRLVRG